MAFRPRSRPVLVRQKNLWPVYLSLLITLGIWAAYRLADGGFGGLWPTVAKGAALLALILMSWSVLLATRWPGFERWFGGLDKVYQAHKWIGRLAFLFIWLHPLGLALRRWPDAAAGLGYFLPRAGMSEFSIAFNLGVAAFYGLIVLVAFSLWVKLPYHVWKHTHAWFGVVLLLAGFHVLLVDRDINAYPLLGVWMYGWMLAALAGYVYIKFLYHYIGPRFVYRVADIERHGDSLELTFDPVGEKMDFRPSQFVYLVINKKDFSREPHPFSIASGYNRAARFKLGIRALGDYTRHLHELGKGDEVTVYGPYGQFSDKFLIADRDCVFIGGGIGITPFLGMWHVALNSKDREERDKLAAHLQTMHPELIRDWPSPKVALFYAEQNERAASFHNDIIQEAIVSQFEGFERFESRGHYYELFLAEEQNSFLSAAYVDSKTPGGVKDKNIFLCGPPVMMQSLIKQFRALGVPNHRLITENFDLVG